MLSGSCWSSSSSKIGVVSSGGFNSSFNCLYSASGISSAVSKYLFIIYLRSSFVGVGGCASSGVVGSCILKYCVVACCVGSVSRSCVMLCHSFICVLVACSYSLRYYVISSLLCSVISASSNIIYSLGSSPWHNLTCLLNSSRVFHTNNILYILAGLGFAGCPLSVARFI